jgi:hypothetical protein
LVEYKIKIKAKENDSLTDKVVLYYNYKWEYNMEKNKAIFFKGSKSSPDYKWLFSLENLSGQKESWGIKPDKDGKKLIFTDDFELQK